MSLRAEKAILLFSGGQDSATCLFYALENFAEVETIGFRYGQRHHIEMEVRQEFLSGFRKIFPEYAEKLKGDKIYDLPILSDIGETSLTRETEIYMLECGLPSTFVPGRNIMFFTVAASHGWRKSISHIIGGMCQTDYSGYPDCRDNTLKSLQVSLSLGLDMPLILHTPLMWLSKAESWKIAYDIAGQKAVDFIIENTHSCYKGERSKRHIWGYGCGKCPACVLRKQGFERYASLTLE
ncbi:MAG: 7-cyano-7-deazaguanine synthase QueC [Pseudomonadota bacterium]